MISKLPNTSASNERFDVYWWDVKGNQHHDKQDVSVEEVKLAVTRLTSGPGSLSVDRCIVTDQGDFTNFEWTRKDGVIFPTEEDLKNAGR